MRRFLKSLICVVLISCVISCESNSLNKVWFYTHNVGTLNQTSTLTPASFLNIQKDGTYTKDFGEFEYGHWKKEKDILLLTSSSNQKTELRVKYLGVKDMQLITNKNVVASFEAQPSVNSAQTDPFSLANNMWRIPATHKESEEEIRKRIQNHCKFWEAYFAWALENRIDFIDVRSTPSPVRIYGNGFALKPYSDLPTAWRSYFFDAEDCRIGSNLLYEVFQYNDIAWAHTDNKYKMFLGAFQQIQQFMK